MTWTVSDIIRLSCGLAGKDIEPRENILNAGESLPGEPPGQRGHAGKDLPCNPPSSRNMG